MSSWSTRSALARAATRVAPFSVIALTFATVLAAAAYDDSAKDATRKSDTRANPATKTETTPEKVGVLLNDSRAFPGYNLINPGRKQTYLYDNDGRVVHTWKSEYSSGAAAYLLDNGHLFRPSEAAKHKQGFQGPAVSGRFQEFDWDGNVVWEFEYHTDKRLPHHDAIKLPNGNVLAICWEWIDEKEAVAAGRRPESVKGSHLQPDCLVELKPTGTKTAEVVWEWRSWDHLIQDHDKTKANYGDVAAHPELFDLNYVHGEEPQPPKPPSADAGKSPAAPADAKKDAAKKAAPPPVRKNPDWMHVNAVAYNADLDQIALSSPAFNEIWIIDHSTTTEQAKGHTGGRWGQGGDILYRWGNPKAYGRGTSADQRLFFQHNIQWIPKGYSGGGHLLVFNNGGGRKPEEYSAVDEFIPPTRSDGHYVRPEWGRFGPATVHWSYSAPNKKDFFSWFISGAQRLPNGNTLINAGAYGFVFEVTPDGETVWKFSNPFKPMPPGARPGGAPPRRFAVLDARTRDALVMSPEQRKKLDEVDKELLARLDKILSAEQIKRLSEPDPNEPADFSKRPAGEYLIAFDRSTLKVNDAQRKELQGLQKEFDPKIAGILTVNQKKMVADFKKGQAPQAGGRGTPRRQGNTLFRATRYALDHPAFAGRTLKPGKTLLEAAAESEEQKPKAEAGANGKSAAAAP